MLKQKPDTNASKGIFDSIPEDVSKWRIAPFLNLKGYGLLSRTSKGVSTLFQEPFEDVALRQFLQAVVDDNPEKVKNMLEVRPDLLLKQPKPGLLIKSELTDQTFYAKEALKMAVMRGQLDMVELLCSYFKTIKDINGPEEALKQLEACEVSEEIKKERESQYRAKLYTLIEHIKKETFPNNPQLKRVIDKISDDTQKILEDFRKELIPKSPITLDTFFDIDALLLASYEAYHKKFDDFQNNHQRNLYCIAIIGFIQSVASPDLAKVFCEGLHDVVEENQHISDLARSFKLKNDKDHSIYRTPSDRASGTGCGFNFLVGWDPSWVVGVGSEVAPSILKNYTAQKQSSLATLKTTLKQVPTHLQEPPHLKIEKGQLI